MTSLKNIGHLGQAARRARQIAEIAEKLATSVQPLHQADIDLLRMNSLQLYEELLMLGAELTDVHLVKDAPEHNVKKETASPEPPATPQPEPAKASTANAEPETIAPRVETILSPPKTTPAKATTDTTENLPRQKQTSGFLPDLFSDGTIPLADKMAAQPDNTLAARLGKSPISDLRKAIGINDKFLFINELFEGNIQQYNHAIDELDGFKSYNGAKTYLIELSVLYGWDPESAAAQKLHELIERKFEHA
ncbi:MAG: hypothetical protein IPM52_08670 [Bacteroidetes bacterium]|nr:hypothetical protein [Bacteroidota bacterium]